MKYVGYVSIFFFIATSTLQLKAQVLPVGTPVLEDYYRRLQLLGKVDSTLSFTIRPLTNQSLQQVNIYDPLAEQDNQKGLHHFAGGAGMIQLMPIEVRFRYTSAYPAGWNDGGMIPAVGAQQMTSVGVYAKYKWFSVQLKPELITAQNKSYSGFNGQTEASWELWYQYTNNIDIPERFGNGTYTKILPGQSSIRFNYDPISFGLSTENLWWGPGIQNSLLMSNTAPGFPHLTLNTTKPIQSMVGTFEGQVVAGRLESSGYAPTPLGNPNHYDSFYDPKPDDWRYFSGFIISYQPRWLAGLSIGASRSFVINHEDMGNGLGDILPFFRAKNTSIYHPDGQQTGEQNKKRDEYKSVFARWVMPKGKLEFYVEYGRNDPGWDSRDRFVEMDHTRGYVLGFRKLVPVRESLGEYIDVGLELTQIDGTRTAKIRSSPSWYVSNTVRSGYTHLGQVLGAGIGPGGSLQTLNIAWVRGLKKLGLQVERQEHQLDFFYEAVLTQGDFRRNWVDVSVKLIGNLPYKRFLFFGDLWFIKALNYQYELEDLYENPRNEDYWNFKRNDKFNFQANIGVMYRF
ncbi:MAG TPA: capsule assembly Wzi family protein [Pseudosphingobacterium sp.]|nr:capsule assembly Wzi family protein [Pseudosphingobacterium sp.]